MDIDEEGADTKGAAGTSALRSPASGVAASSGSVEVSENEAADRELPEEALRATNQQEFARVSTRAALVLVCSACTLSCLIVRIYSLALLRSVPCLTGVSWTA